jgi:hypothetical protein
LRTEVSDGSFPANRGFFAPSTRRRFQNEVGLIGKIGA